MIEMLRTIQMVIGANVAIGWIVSLI